MVGEAKPVYQNMVMLGAWSIRHRAGALKDAPITVVFNDRDDPATTAFLRDELDVNVEVMPRVKGASVFANKYNAYLSPKVRSADWVVLMDCDTAVINPLDPMLDWMSDEAGLDFMGAPVNAKTIWGYRKILERHTGLSATEIEKHAHEWNVCRYPYFNAGFTAIRGERLDAFREGVISMTKTCFDSMRVKHTPGVIGKVRLGWNRFAVRVPALRGVVWPPFHPVIYSEQVAMGAIVLKQGLRYKLLPHSFNWRAPNQNQGEESPIRVLHYLKAKFPVDRENLFDAPWIAEYERSDNEGRQALAKVVRDFNADPATAAARN